MDKNIPQNIAALEIREVGFVKEVKRGVAKVGGLPSCIYGQLVKFECGIKGMVMGFNPQEAVVIILGEERLISVGDSVTTFSELFNVPVGDNFLGRVVNSVGEPLDDKGEIEPSENYPVFKEALGVMARHPIDQSLQTGIKIADLIIPIGKGQRELIIGDRQTGKTSFGIDSIINQKGKNVICIYCWVGGSYSSFQNFMQILKDNGALEYTIAVCAPAAVSAAEQYLCPYTAATIGEYFMDRGRDVLVVFDDLTKHAWIYRQMSLLLERAPGREAYPGDVFYLHSQLLERAGRLKAELGGGTMTFLPIVETLQGDITGYIQTNLISITDGQIYFNSSLFQEGFKPAIDVGLSVSRIGSKVQCPAIKKLGAGLRLEYAQYRDMLRLTRLRTRLSKEAEERMKRGKALEELFIQQNFLPLSQAEEIIVFYAFNKKILQALPIETVHQFKNEIFSFSQKINPSLVDELNEKGEWTDEIKSRIDNVLVAYFKNKKES